MSELHQPVGARLRAAREAQGLSVEEAANRLRLMHRQIDAMERDDFDSLGQPVFARGFVRNYARLLGLNPDALLSQMAGAPTDSTPVQHPAVPPASAGSRAMPWLLILALGLLVVVIAPVGLYWWLNSEVDEPVVALSGAPAPVVAPAAPGPAEPVTAPVPAPAEPEPGTTPAADASEPVEAAATLTQGALQLEFAGESWVEIKDASGKMLLRKLNPPGTRADVTGQPPFDLLIGNAAQVRLTYNGRPIDLKPFIEVTVARFTLEE